jgi:hypothetical protein
VSKCGHILRGGIGALIRDFARKLPTRRGSSISQARKLRGRVWEGGIVLGVHGNGVWFGYRGREGGRGVYSRGRRGRGRAEW